MRALCRRNEKSHLDFDDSPFLTDTDYKYLLGSSKDDLNTVCDSVKDHVKETPSRSLQKSVSIFLCKLKTGLSNQILSTIFYTSKSSIRRVTAAVRKALWLSKSAKILSLNMLQDNKSSIAILAQTLFNDVEKNQHILVLDGTYIYKANSNNFHFQRRSYSIHKGRPLIKPIVIVTTTGYFVSIFGPYIADNKNNEASILQHIIKTNAKDIRSWLSEDDIFIVDRGFRDALPLLEDLGRRQKCHHFLRRNKSK